VEPVILERANGSEVLVELGWFREVTGGLQFVRAKPILRPVTPTDYDHRDFLQVWIRLYFSKNLEAIDAGQIEIQ
jgi:hypothetical protein